ncbi:MAG: D-alanyl-D-alanine carboxypeptidase/D-alanyl-D-alanine endopeptidase [Chitinophagaceae bacterium]
MEKAWRVFNADAQLQHASAAFELVQKTDGKQLFGRNEEMLLSPASTQKVLTAAAALELLKPSFRFTTQVLLKGTVVEGKLKGDLVIKGGGDPTLGSTRFDKNGAENFLSSITNVLRQKGIHTIEGDLVLLSDNERIIPDGWIWQDLGNYYGAGASGFNWRENQYDMLLSSGANPGADVKLVRTEPELYLENVELLLKAGTVGSGDNAYIYFEPGQEKLTVRGTIPPGKTAFSISGALPDPSAQFLSELAKAMMTNGIEVTGKNRWRVNEEEDRNGVLLLEKQSPPLEEIVYWFLNKSVNLYGEALLKEIAFLQKGRRDTETGTAQLKAFWAANGIPALMLQIQDGSGLSPQNGVTAAALNKVLVYAAKQSWFSAFYKGLTVNNGLHLKSGTIGGVKCYTGFLKSKDGKEYCFSIMVNRYNGSTAVLNKKIFAFLETCK